MSRNNHHLFRMFAAFDVADHVRALHVRQSLRRHHQFHFYPSLVRKIDHQVRVLGRYPGGPEFWAINGVLTLGSVGDPIVLLTHGTKPTTSRRMLASQR